MSQSESIKPVPTLGGKDSSAKQALPWRVIGRRAVMVGKRCLGWLFHWVTLPIRLVLALRRAMTAASVTLLLLGIVSLNIVWGYPWMGMFAACATMLVFGLIINRAMRPRLWLDYSLPSSAPAGQPFALMMHVHNRGRLPAMEMTIGFTEPPKPRHRLIRFLISKFWHGESSGNPIQSHEAAEPIGVLRPDGRCDLPWNLVSPRRGVFRLPDVMVTSLFPFHLFRSTDRYPTPTEIAITPRPIPVDDDPIHQRMLESLEGFSHRLLAGDALDYTGSREYEVGMPVRRWDFSSWARLGRPIVREFQSPSVPMVNVIVDTTCEDAQGQSHRRSINDGTSRSTTDDAAEAVVNEEPLEKLLSLAATALTEFARKQARVRLFVTGEAVGQWRDRDSASTLFDAQPMLIRLASAKSTERSLAEQAIADVLETIERMPTLILAIDGNAAKRLAVGRKEACVIDLQQAVSTTSSEVVQ